MNGSTRCADGSLLQLRQLFVHLLKLCESFIGDLELEAPLGLRGVEFGLLAQRRLQGLEAATVGASASAARLLLGHETATGIVHRLSHCFSLKPRVLGWRQVLEVEVRL